MNATNTHPHESGAARVLRAVPDEPGQFGDGWEQPVPLTTTQRALPPFPVHVLPGWMADMVNAVTEFTQTPPDLAGCVALSALSTAAGGRITTCIRPGWTQPVNLFVIVALPPGSRKSDVFAAMAGPIRAAQAELVDLALPRIEEARVQKAVAEREAEKLEKKASTADAVSIGMAGDAALRAQEIVIPAKPRLVVDDVTAEMAATIMSQQGGRLAVLAPEGGIVANIAGRYSGTPNYEVFLRGHAGEYLEVDRQGRESDFIEHAYLTLGLVVQPQIVRDLGQIKAAKERGLLGRFLYSLPVSTVGHRAIRVPEIPDHVAADYRARIGGLTLQLAMWSAPEVVDFSTAADEAMFELQAEIEPRLGPSGAWHHIADWAGKYAGTVARLAGLLHLADRPSDAWHYEIGVSTFARARELGSYFLAHALGAFDHMSKDESYDDARALLTWIAGDHVPQFTRRDAHRANRKRFASASEVGSALELLEEHGHIRQIPLPDRQGVGRKPSPTYVAHPVHLSAGPGQFGQNGQNHG
ncbi:YfjI family protein [Lentzea sp. NPDC055074]